MSSKKFYPFKDFQSDQIQRSSRKTFTTHYACRNAVLNLALVTGTTDGFIIQIIGNSLIESCAGVRLTCLDCKITVSCAVMAILYLLITCLLFLLTFRSILTFPWVELGGKVNITWAKTGYNPSITFHTKPFYGGKLHRVTGEAKNTSTGRVICKVNGEWNGKIEISFTSHQVCVYFSYA